MVIDRSAGWCADGKPLSLGSYRWMSAFSSVPSLMSKVIPLRKLSTRIRKPPLSVDVVWLIRDAADVRIREVDRYHAAARRGWNRVLERVPEVVGHAKSRWECRKATIQVERHVIDRLGETDRHVSRAGIAALDVAEGLRRLALPIGSLRRIHQRPVDGEDS
jgi:hypothetical protein